MKIPIIIIIACFTILLSVSSGRADDPARFEGMVQGGRIVLQVSSNLSPDGNNNALIHNHDEQASQVNDIYPLILFDFKWAIDSRTKAYLATPIEDNIGLAAGINRSWGFGTLDASCFIGLDSDVWQDPYVTDESRTETRKSTYGGGIKYDGIMATPLNMEYTLRIIDVEKDTLGERFNDLARDGFTHNIELNYGLILGRNMISPGISYTYGDFQGDAQSYQSVSGKISFMKATRIYMLTMALETGLTVYDKNHPIFLNEREDVSVGANAMFSWLNPFHMENSFVNVITGAQTTTSNISFYDEKMLFIGMTFGYRFGG